MSSTVIIVTDPPGEGDAATISGAKQKKQRVKMELNETLTPAQVAAIVEGVLQAK